MIRLANAPFERFDGYLVAGLRGPLRKLLEYIDILLESIVKALGIGDAIEEIKKYVEKFLGD